MNDEPAFESKSRSERRREDMIDDTGWRRIEFEPGVEPPVITNVPEV